MTYGPIDFSDQDGIMREKDKLGRDNCSRDLCGDDDFFVVLVSLTKQQENQVLSLHRRLCTKSTV